MMGGLSSRRVVRFQADRRLPVGRGRRRGGVLSAACLALVLAGCNAFHPGFLELVDPSGATATIESASGHVVVTFINNAEVDDRLIAYLESAEGGNLGDFTDAERRLLRPRVRLRVLVTFADGTEMDVEFVSGSRDLVTGDFNAQTLPDLNQNDLDNVVVLCDVASVEILPGSDIEVFVPVVLWEYRFITSQNVGGVTTAVGGWLLAQLIPPNFRALQTDDVDAEGNVILQRNIGIRDAPSPVVDPLCGSVIAIVMDGVLTVPFLGGVDVDGNPIGDPSYGQTDQPSLAGIGGRFEFTVSIR